MCVVETLAYSAIQSQGRTDSWSDWPLMETVEVAMPCSSQARHLAINPVAWKSVAIATTNHRITNLLVLAKVFIVKAFLQSSSLTIREINTTLLASLTMKITGVSSTASWCLPGEKQSRNGSLLVWHCLCSPCTHLLAKEAPKDT